jgi:hypothetical protein
MKYKLSDSHDDGKGLVVVKDMNFESNRFSLSWLSKTIRGLRMPLDSDSDRTFSRATSYDYAHAIIFLEALRLMDSHFSSSWVSRTTVGKIDSRPFMLSPVIKRKLDSILFEKGWTLSQFLDTVITREYEGLGS